MAFTETKALMLKAYWPEHKMPATKEAKKVKKASVHWHNKHYHKWPAGPACGKDWKQEFMHSEHYSLVTCTACRRLIRLYT